MSALNPKPGYLLLLLVLTRKKLNQVSRYNFPYADLPAFIDPTKTNECVGGGARTARAVGSGARTARAVGGGARTART